MTGIRATRVGGALGLIVLVFATAITSAASATFPGANGRIAYRGDEYPPLVHTVLPSGNGDRILAPQTWDLASWSPNGTQLVFAGVSDADQPDLYRVQADGSDIHRLTSYGQYDPYGGAWSPSYSPGGGRIVFEFTAYHAPVWIGTRRLEGSGSGSPTVIGQTTRGDARPIWSPAGDIAYTEPDTDTHNESIWAMRPDGSNKHRLVYLGRGGGWGPIYSPDGSKFIFVRIWGNGSIHTLLADADGSHVREFPCKAFSTGTVSPQLSGLVPAAYSPDGRWILAARYYLVDNSDRDSNLVRVSVGSCKGERVIGHASPAGPASWQPLPVG